MTVNFHFLQSEERIDPRDLDELLTEMTLISSRSELYKQFLMKSITHDLRSDCAKKNIDLSYDNNLKTDQVNNENEKKIEEAELFIKSCNLSFTIQELIGQYSILENYFMTENINKAIQMDTIISGNQTSSVVDDVFFIIKKCIK